MEDGKNDKRITKNNQFREPLCLYYQTDGEEASIYRIYGTLPIVVVPEYIGKYRVTEVGAYCFSDRNHVPEDCSVFSEEEKGEDSGSMQNETSRELTGEYIRQVVLPDSVWRIDNAAFFGCRKLESLEIGNQALTIGSDVFNNCSRLRHIKVRGTAAEPSGIRQIVGRISWEVEVSFEDAAILYPEYFETYDTIAPAHIFGLNIEGEGFRARQCFREEVVDFAGYDGIFGKACAEESVETLGRMALNRLMMPLQLTEPYREAYETYVKEHNMEILRGSVKKKEREQMRFLCQNQYAEAEALEAAVQEAIRANWSEGAASLLEWKHLFYQKKKEGRYEF